ncbi:hypothetical protein MVES1_003277 [Malassezia vespertilionis]|uniref:uncharacterized protein n=1 Tax=Malassezia vespertilionis TaxID=2020962 RepID=UPI0024B1275B|nr:uncharacterized protein MVES1_003277 [Malassezia vespertilionis]WFD07908.1 hypothetical protein MVES1_003277 [Malassezia vespertilionis]
MFTSNGAESIGADTDVAGDQLGDADYSRASLDHEHFDEEKYGDEKLDTTESEINEADIQALVEEDHGHEIKLRTMSWQKASWLLAGDQVGLAVMSQAWSLSVLGWAAGIMTMLVAGVLFVVTSITMHRYIMRNPQIKDICDFGYYVFGKSRVAYVFSGFMLLANNIILIGFHILMSARVLNTLSDHSLCTVVFNIIGMVMGIVFSLPRTLHHVSFMSMFSAFCMGMAILLWLIFSGIQDHPMQGPKKLFPDDGPVRTYARSPPGTTWVDAMNAMLNITFMWVPQILFPTFIAEMERPQDFPKALAVLTGLQFFLFIIPPSIGYYYLGQYTTSPAFASLQTYTYQKASFAFVIVASILIAGIYANVSAKFIYARVMGKSRHAHSNTATGWGMWFLIMAVIWVVAWIFAEVIPSVGDFLSLLGAAFDSFFGFIFFAVAYWQMNRGRYFNGLGKTMLTLVHVIVMACGLFLLGPGLYAAVEAIIADYSSGTKPAFSCENVAL